LGWGEASGDSAPTYIAILQVCSIHIDIPHHASSCNTQSIKLNNKDEVSWTLCM